MDSTTVKALPVDELGLAVLNDLVITTEWNEYNYLNSASQDRRLSGDDAAPRAVAEALTWLRSRGLIARTPGQTADAAIFVTRAGHQAIKRGLRHVRATHRIQEGLHPLVERPARRQFLLGEYEQAIFVAMKAVEVRVRELGGFGDELIGVDLMNRAFGPNGLLTDKAAVKGEQEGTRPCLRVRTRCYATPQDTGRSTTTTLLRPLRASWSPACSCACSTMSPIGSRISLRPRRWNPCG